MIKSNLLLALLAICLSPLAAQGEPQLPPTQPVQDEFQEVPVIPVEIHALEAAGEIELRLSSEENPAATESSLRIGNFRSRSWLSFTGASFSPNEGPMLRWGALVGKFRCSRTRANECYGSGYLVEVSASLAATGKVGIGRVRIGGRPGGFEATKLILVQEPKHPDWFRSNRVVGGGTRLGVEFEFGPIFPSRSWKSTHAFINLTQQILAEKPLADRKWRLDVGVTSSF